MDEEIFTEFEEEVLDAVYEINLARGTATPPRISDKIGAMRFENGKTPLSARIFLGLSHLFFKVSKEEQPKWEIEARRPSIFELHDTLESLEEEGFLRSREIEGTNPVIDEDTAELFEEIEKLKRELAELGLEDYQPERPSNREYFLSGPGRRQPTPKGAFSDPSSLPIPT